MSEGERREGEREKREREKRKRRESETERKREFGNLSSYALLPPRPPPPPPPPPSPPPLPPSQLTLFEEVYLRRSSADVFDGWPTYQHESERNCEFRRATIPTENHPAVCLKPGFASIVGMAAPVTVQLSRQTPLQPWGFRLQGGRDFRVPLSVKKVTPNTPAQGKLTPGDAILAIETYDATGLTHMQASQLIQSSGVMLRMTLDKGHCASLRPKGPVKFSAGRAYACGY
ncbi:hypothetical protein LSAT2_003615 [Lamellibrachia satsuma]|nr:hypothetical protein LSAT2_003615 [Lamellibrachia satsuma]